MPKKSTTTRKVSKNSDFGALFEQLTTAVNANEVLSQDALLAQQLRDFGRMAEMNNALWDSIKTQGYHYIDERTGRMIINPAVGTFNKNQSTLLKTAQWIEEKTKAISVDAEKKSW